MKPFLPLFIVALEIQTGLSLLALLMSLFPSGNFSWVAFGLFFAGLISLVLCNVALDVAAIRERIEGGSDSVRTTREPR